MIGNFFFILKNSYIGKITKAYALMKIFYQNDHYRDALSIIWILVELFSAFSDCRQRASSLFSWMNGPKYLEPSLEPSVSLWVRRESHSCPFDQCLKLKAKHFNCDFGVRSLRHDQPDTQKGSLFWFQVFSSVFAVLCLTS